MCTVAGIAIVPAGGNVKCGCLGRERYDQRWSLGAILSSDRGCRANRITGCAKQVDRHAVDGKAQKDIQNFQRNFLVRSNFMLEK